MYDFIEQVFARRSSSSIPFLFPFFEEVNDSSQNYNFFILTEEFSFSNQIHC